MELPQFSPKPAHTAEETGISPGLISELVMKHLFLAGTTSLKRLMQDTKLHYEVVHSVFRELQKEQVLEVKKMIGHDYEISLTLKGMRITEEVYRKNRYVGPAPVSLEDYRRAVCAQVFHPDVTRESLAEHLSDLVVTDDIISDLGAALMTGGMIFIYGPTGNGKTSIAERLGRIYHDYVYIPHAVEVLGQVMSVFDGIAHRAVPEQPEDIDCRWVLCQRPFLTVGGEMQAHMLDLYFDENTHMIRPPIQMKANMGILLIDDFGRQHVQPRELLNRWIVPLDRRVDYLSMPSGVSFEIPFELIVVFATNLELSHLAEEAFMRRIRNKIKIDKISDEVFLEILQRQCEQRGISYSPETAQYTLQACREHSVEGLRGCYPRDLLEIVCGIAAFERRRARFDQRDVDGAAKIYFMR